MNRQTLLNASILMLLAGWSPAAHAASCDAYFPFDGTLAEAGGRGLDGEMLAAEGEPAQALFVEGKYGQALKLDGTAAMRTLLDLHYDRCPQVTVSAWIRVSRDAPAEPMHVLSTGSGSGPGLTVSGSFLTLSGTDNGIGQPNAIPKGAAWIFVAGVYDYAAGDYTLYWRGRSASQKLAEYRYEPQPAFWVGTLNDDWGIFANGIAVDELRITGRALSHEQVADLREAVPTSDAGQPGVASAEASLPPCDVQEDCATGSYCAFDNTCHPESHLPKRTFELTTLDAPPIDANLVVDEDARTTEPAPEPEPEPEPVPSHVRPGPVGQPSLTVVSGIEGTIKRSVILDNGFVSKIQWWEQSDRPCKVNVYGWQPSGDADGSAGDSESVTMGGHCEAMPTLSLTTNSSIHEVALDDEDESAIGRIQVCLNNPYALQRRIKGIRIWGDRINDDGSTSGLPNGDSEALTHCAQWSTNIACGAGQHATGLVVHATEASGVREQITGLQLVCRSKTAPGRL